VCSFKGPRPGATPQDWKAYWAHTTKSAKLQRALPAWVLQLLGWWAGISVLVVPNARDPFSPTPARQYGDQCVLFILTEHFAPVTKPLWSLVGSPARHHTEQQYTYCRTPPSPSLAVSNIPTPTPTPTPTCFRHAASSRGPFTASSNKGHIDPWWDSACGMRSLGVVPPSSPY
jgi:hypothetical protein